MKISKTCPFCKERLRKSKSPLVYTEYFCENMKCSANYIEEIKIDMTVHVVYYDSKKYSFDYFPENNLLKVWTRNNEFLLDIRGPNIDQCDLDKLDIKIDNLLVFL